jgi:hypothetical protein
MTLLRSDLRYCVCDCLEGLRKSTNAFGQDIPSPCGNLNPETLENEPGLLAFLQRYSLKGYSLLCEHTRMCFLSASTVVVKGTSVFVAG